MSENNDSKEKNLKDLQDISKIFNEAMKEIENQQEEYWNSLTKDQQLKVFCAVVRRIFKGEIEEKGSYRWVLYNVFGFGPESYVQAQDAGYLAIHNSIFSSEHESRMLRAFCTKYKIDDAEKKIIDFLI